jgi:hypothetical protein
MKMRETVRTVGLSAEYTTQDLTNMKHEYIEVCNFLFRSVFFETSNVEISSLLYYRQTDPGAYPASCTMGTGVKRPGRGIDHPPPSSAEVKERVELYLYSPSELSWPVIG